MSVHLVPLRSNGAAEIKRERLGFSESNDGKGVHGDIRLGETRLALEIDPNAIGWPKRETHRRAKGEDWNATGARRIGIPSAFEKIQIALRENRERTNRLDAEVQVKPGR